MVRNVRKMSAKVKEELAQRARILDREKDTIYWLVFLPIEGMVTTSAEQADLWNSQWRVNLPGNPEKNPEFIDRAIVSFKANRGIKSWREVATDYRVDALYNP